MRILILSVLALAGLTLGVNAQDKPKPEEKPKTTHEDKLFGVTVKIEGFGNTKQGDSFTFLKAYAVEEGANPVVSLGMQRAQKLTEYAQTMGTGMLLLGLKETERKDAKLGSLKATLLVYTSAREGLELGANILLAEDKGNLWALRTVYEGESKAAAVKLFDTMAKSFKNSVAKIDPKKPPANTMVISERFGFTIDTKGSIGTAETFEGIDVFEMDIVQDKRQVAYLVVQYMAGVDMQGMKLEDFADELRAMMEAEGMQVASSRKDMFSGREAICLQMKGDVEGQTFDITGFFVIAGAEMYSVLAGFDESADEEIQKKTKAALVSVKLSNPGKQAAWPKPPQGE